MKTMYKKVISYLLIISMMSFSIVTTAYAGEVSSQSSSNKLNINNKTVEDLNSQLQEMSYDELQQYFITHYIASTEDASLLAQYQMRQSTNTYTFPSHPKIGDRHKESFTVHVTVDGGVSALAGAILGKTRFATVAYALTVAGAILTLGSSVLGNKVRVTTEYTYGYNNDGVLGWTPGYSTYKIIK